MIKNHSDMERGNPLPPHRLLFPITSKISHRQDNTYHGICYTSRASLAGTRNSSIGPPRRIDSMTHRTMSERPYHGATSRSNYVLSRNIEKTLSLGLYGKLVIFHNKSRNNNDHNKK